MSVSMQIGTWNICNKFIERTKELMSNVHNLLNDAYLPIILSRFVQDLL